MTDQRRSERRDPIRINGAMRRKWRKRLGVEPSLPDWRGATDFEDREGHRAPFASSDGLVDRKRAWQDRTPRPIAGRGNTG